MFKKIKFQHYNNTILTINCLARKQVNTQDVTVNEDES